MKDRTTVTMTGSRNKERTSILYPFPLFLDLDLASSLEPAPGRRAAWFHPGRNPRRHRHPRRRALDDLRLLHFHDAHRAEPRVRRRDLLHGSHHPGEDDPGPAIDLQGKGLLRIHDPEGFHGQAPAQGRFFPVPGPPRLQRTGRLDGRGPDQLRARRRPRFGGVLHHPPRRTEAGRGLLGRRRLHPVPAPAVREPAVL